MEIEVLVSTMNQSSKTALVRKMNLNKYTIINQITRKTNVENDDNTSGQKFISYRDKGLSKSRNLAIRHSTSDICVLADDDMYYIDNYEETISRAYNKYPKADIIAFVVDNENRAKNKKKLRCGKLSLLKTMKIQSVQITFRKNKIIAKNIKFDEDFGTGSTYPWGEENIFLFDCKRKGLNIYYIPDKIATLIDTETSSWSRDNTIEHYNNQGIIYYRMSKVLYPFLIIQFVLRKKAIYNMDLKWYQVLVAMFRGVKKYKKSEVINCE